MRLFVAIEIPEEIREKIWNASKDLGIRGVTLTKKEQYHISLQFFGELSESDLPKIKDAVSAVRYKEFAVAIVGISSFDQKLRVIFAQITEGKKDLEYLYENLDRELEKRGVKYAKEHDYKPHLTVARVKSLREKALLLPIMRNYASYDFGSFKATSMVLKLSKPGESGHVYEDLHEVRFGSI